MTLQRGESPSAGGNLGALHASLRRGSRIHVEVGQGCADACTADRRCVLPSPPASPARDERPRRAAEPEAIAELAPASGFRLRLRAVAVRIFSLCVSLKINKLSRGSSVHSLDSLARSHAQSTKMRLSAVGSGDHVYCTYVFSSAARIVSLRQTHSRLVVCRTAVASSSSLPFQQRMPHASFFC